MPPARPASLKVRALQWLAQREHSRSELRDKLLLLLRRSGPSGAEGTEATGSTEPAAEVEALLVWLELHGHLSEARFAESRVNARQSRFGNLRIRQELQQHGVTLDTEAQEALIHSEFDRASVLWRRRYGTVAEDAAGRMRQMRFLAGRGFSMDVVRRLVRGDAVAGDSAEPANDRR